jgi:bacterial/archaeal transporter family-2 protein
MTSTILLAVAALVAAGCALSIQGPINAALARGVGDAGVAGCLSFFVGFAVLAVVSTLRGAWPAGGLFATSVPWWAWIGGFFGAFYVSMLIWSVPKLGVVSTVAALVFGQLAAALLLDRLGLFGLPVQPVSWTRLAGCGLVLAGLVMTRL